MAENAYRPIKQELITIEDEDSQPTEQREAERSTVIQVLCGEVIDSKKKLERERERSQKEIALAKRETSEMQKTVEALTNFIDSRGTVVGGAQQLLQPTPELRQLQQGRGGDREDPEGGVAAAAPAAEPIDFTLAHGGETRVFSLPRGVDEADLFARLKAKVAQMTGTANLKLHWKCDGKQLTLESAEALGVAVRRASAQTIVLPCVELETGVEQKKKKEERPRARRIASRTTVESSEHPAAAEEPVAKKRSLAIAAGPGASGSKTGAKKARDLPEENSATEEEEEEVPEWAAKVLEAGTSEGRSRGIGKFNVVYEEDYSIFKDDLSNLPKRRSVAPQRFVPK